ncbi:SCP2 sterol-binding domain-containing protein [Sporosarcina saromensis]|uniref:SCP2 sterol-binding domain-containing protein n=1 Tax=Sporosarcina saromensis TaxID=359365 RepID=A0ABU4G6F1_9BACL|nr:SCP2 sterol-binding domain-containing protein [Sporosarcina saromensis]MDW0112548.1 SCP2 sterol-binding domain-containing protein [Sporosarcina saromensis]
MNVEAMSMDAIWHEIRKRLLENREPYKGLKTTYRIELTGEDGGSYVMKFMDESAEVYDETDGKSSEEVDCSLKMSVKDFKKLLIGDFNSAAAFMMGKLKVKGNIGLALQLENLLKEYQL